MTSRLPALLLALGLLRQTEATAQLSSLRTGDWRLTRFTSANKLPSDEVLSVTESGDGTIWAATAAGLAWFDGWFWRPVPADSTGVPRRAARHLSPGTGSSVIVVVHNLLYLGDTTGFRRLPLVVGGAEYQVGYAVQTRDGVLILGIAESDTSDAPLVLYRNGALERITPPAPLRHIGVPALYGASNGDVWLNTTGGLWRRDAAGWRLRFPADGGNHRLNHLVEGVTGEGLVSMLESGPRPGLWEWSGAGRFVARPGEGIALLLSAAVQADGSVVAVYSGGYLRHRQDGRWSDLGPEHSLFQDARAVFFDRHGDLWVSTGSGLILYRSSSRLWSGHAHGFPSRRDRIHALLALPSGELWAATADGIDVFTPGGSVRHIGEAAGRPLRIVTGLARDSAGNIWVTSGSDFPGALRFDGRSWRAFGPRDGLTASTVHAVTVDRAGRVWFLGLGTGPYGREGPGAFVLERGVFTRWGTAEGLPSGRVYAFAEGPDDTRWFGTAGGLSRWRQGVWTHWRERAGFLGRPFRAPIRVFTVAVAPDGRPWFGDHEASFAYGLGTIDERDSLTFLNTADGLLNNMIWQVRTDSSGAVWIATESGLSVHDHGNWFAFGTDRGLGHPQLWPILLHDGVVTVGTQGGGLRHLRLADAVQPAPKVTIDETVVERGRIHLRWTAAAYRGTLPAHLVATRHRIDGAPWSAWSDQRAATLTGVASGRHVVEIQARGLFRAIDSVSASTRVRVPLPLLLRPTVAAPIGLLSVALATLSILVAYRKRESAATLRESEARFRTLSEATFEGIAISIDGRIVEANDQLVRMLGAERSSLIGRPLLDFVVEQSHEALAAHATTDSARPIEHVERRVDGTLFPAESRGRSLPFRGATARVTAIRDVTAQRLADEALRASEEKFETAFRAIPEPITISTYPDGRIVDVNSGFETASGWSREEIVGRSGVELGLFPKPEQAAQLVDSLANAAQVRGLALTMRSRHGELRHLLVSAELMMLNGAPHILAIASDVTERRLLEAQLLQAQKMDAIGRLAGGVAHDFNNLLTAIIGHAELLEPELDGTAADDLRQIRTAASRAADLTRQLLTFARKQRVEPKLINLNELVRGTDTLLRRLLGEQIVVVTQTASNLPTVRSDPGQIEQVVVNLAVNARDAMPGGGQLTIETERTVLDEEYTHQYPDVRPGLYAVIAVTDTGTGIPVESRSRIFEPFFTTKEVGKGTGLGLAICYGIVREAGGHIGVYSEMGLGTTFRVYLPAADGTPARSAAEEAKPLPRGTETILLVEDETAVRNLVTRVLSGLGYTVLDAGRGDEALARLAESEAPPRLLITDVVLPGPGGVEVAAQVRSRVPGITVLYISGYTERTAGHAVALDGPLLAKPFTPHEIARRVREALDAAAR